MPSLNDKVAFITGSSSGIGAASALRFAEEGARVFGFDLSEATSGDWQAACEIQPANQFAAGDVTSSTDLEQAVAQCLQAFGRIDILLNSAGVAGGGPVHLCPEEDFKKTIDVNLTGTYLASQKVLPAMIEQGSGSILNLASVEGLEAQEFTAAYNASKGGVVLLTKNMAIDYGRMGIRVNAICPGFIETPMTAALEDSAMREAVSAAHQLGRMGTPREVANVATFLASDDASFVSGCSMTVDGGFNAGKRFGIAEMFAAADAG